MKGMVFKPVKYQVIEASSEALHLLSEEGIKQVGESAKLRNSNSWQYLTGFI